jgi:hypothetical protein
VSDALVERLNQLLPTLTAEEFLAASGVGNEIPYHVFEYPAEQELLVRRQIDFLLDRIPKARPGTRVASVNLFDFLVEHLRGRNLLERSFEMERKQGRDHLHRHLATLLHPDKISPLLAKSIPDGQTDLVLIHGVGSAWPFLRASAVLNSLHKYTGHTPVVMFYPGSYDQTAFRLFGKVRDKDKQDNYYRAFRLLPPESRR